jgi:hypothetical protein
VLAARPVADEYDVLAAGEVRTVAGERFRMPSQPVSRKPGESLFVAADQTSVGALTLSEAEELVEQLRTWGRDAHADELADLIVLSRRRHLEQIGKLLKLNERFEASVAELRIACVRDGSFANRFSAQKLITPLWASRRDSSAGR